MQVDLHSEVQLGLLCEHPHLSPPSLLLPGQLGIPQDCTVHGHPCHPLALLQTVEELHLVSRQHLILLSFLSLQHV